MNNFGTIFFGFLAPKTRKIFKGDTLKYANKHNFINNLKKKSKFLELKAILQNDLFLSLLNCIQKFESNENLINLNVKIIFNFYKKQVSTKFLAFFNIC